MEKIKRDEHEVFTPEEVMEYLGKGGVYGKEMKVDFKSQAVYMELNDNPIGKIKRSGEVDEWEEVYHYIN